MDEKLGALGKLYASLTDEEMNEVFDEDGNMPPVDWDAHYASENYAWEVVDSMKDSDKTLVKELVGILSNDDDDFPGKKKQEELIERAVEIIEMDIPKFDLNLKLLPYGETLLYGAVVRFHRISASMKLVQALLDHGADPSEGNNMDDSTALDYLTEDGEGDLNDHQKAIVKLLRESGAKTYVQQKEELVQQRLEDQREAAKGHCANCGKLESSATEKLKRCTGCKVVWYCNAACQRAHRKEHKAYCKRIESIEK